MSAITKPLTIPSRDNNVIPVGDYVCKITNIDNSNSKESDEPMFAIDTIILTTFEGADVVNDGFTIGGRALKRDYLSFSEKALPFTMEKLKAMGVSDEALETLNDTANQAWIDEHLKNRCFVAMLANEERFYASDGKGYTPEYLKQVNSKLPTQNQIQFLKNQDGSFRRAGLSYVIRQYVGPATPDGHPF